MFKSMFKSKGSKNIWRKDKSFQVILPFKENFIDSRFYLATFRVETNQHSCFEKLSKIRNSIVTVAVSCIKIDQPKHSKIIR